MQIKCTSCGATQELAANHQCGYCGSAIEQEKAQENYKASTTGEVGNLMMMAETAVDATNWEEALQYYNKALEKDITNSDAWLGKGIAMVYTSKIGDIKTKEAIAYWKNAIKHAENADAMGKRVAKEINTVVNAFYPAIENHYIEFSGLDNSYQELVSRFATLENAQDYATQLDNDNIAFHETGYALCKRVIELPQRYAAAAHGSALAEGIVGQLSSNKYSRQYAASDARSKMSKASARKNEILTYAKLVFEIEDKYLNSLRKLNPGKNYVSSRDAFAQTADGKKAAIDEAMKEKGLGAAVKVWWGNQSTVAKVAWVSFFIILFLAAIFQDK
jgi:tetratricopeptide (TPR) repeat protein